MGRNQQSSEDALLLGVLVGLAIILAIAAVYVFASGDMRQMIRDLRSN